MSNLKDDNEEYLRNLLESNENHRSDNIVFDNTPKTRTAFERASDLSYMQFDIIDLPCGEFYPNGTMLKIRAATVREIQAYSMVNDENMFDLIDKANDIIAECVRIERPDGSYGSYLELKDADRIYLLFVIRDLTFQKGATLNSTIECECGKIHTINLNRHSFNYYEIDEQLLPYFNPVTKLFDFELTNGKVYSLGVPTIGLQKSFYSYLIKHVNDKKKLNAAFFKIIPFTISNRISITEEGIKKTMLDFENIDENSFQFLNQAVEKMKFGIKEIKTNCDACAEEAHAEFTFPDNKPSRLFVDTSAFENFIKKK